VPTCCSAREEAQLATTIIAHHIPTHPKQG
jgi:hypothetical protein